MEDKFTLHLTDRPVRNQNLNNLEIVKRNTSTYGTNSLISLGPKIWNSLPHHLKSCDILTSFNNAIKMWNGKICQCTQGTKFE